MVSIDEAVIGLSNCNKRQGTAMLGNRARAEGFTPRDGTKLSLILAIDVRTGAVAHMLWAGTMSKVECFAFERFLLMPALAGTGPRQTLKDNHSAHHQPAVDQLYLAAGHPLPLFGPVQTPQFAPVEWAIGACPLLPLTPALSDDPGTTRPVA